MADETEKLKAKLANLNNSLDGLEEALEPLLSQSLPETVVNLDTIQQAKLQVAIPYLVYDLVFIYLKTRGIDPRTHPVIAELDRVRQYFDKIKNAENPPKRTLPVDKDAANRFIKHAISQVRQTAPVAGPSTHVKFDDAGIAHDIRDIPVKVTEKMLAREEYQKELREAGSDEEEEELEVIDDAEEEEDSEPSAAYRKGKGKAASPPEDTSTELGSKRRRRPVDPFAGYGDEVQQTETTTTTVVTTISESSVKRLKTMALEEDFSMSAPASGVSTPTSVASSGKSRAKKSKKRS